MSKHSSAAASNMNGAIVPASASSVLNTRKTFLRTRHFKYIPPRSGAYPRGSHVSESSLYLRVPKKFYECHLRTCVRLLVEMSLDRSMLYQEQFFVCEEMRVLVSWVTSENAMSWSVKEVRDYVRKLCDSISCDPRTGACPELSTVFIDSIYNLHLRSKQSME